MALHHMANLVSHHARELVHLVRALDDAPVHVDEATRQREGVHDIRVHDKKVPVQITAVGELRDRIAEHVDVLLDGGVGDDWQIGVHLRRILLPHPHFLLRRDGASASGGGRAQREHTQNSIHEFLVTCRRTRKQDTYRPARYAFLCVPLVPFPRPACRVAAPSNSSDDAASRSTCRIVPVSYTHLTLPTIY